MAASKAFRAFFSTLIPAALLALLFVAWVYGGGRSTENSRPVLIEVEKAPRGVVYKVDSKPTGHTSETDILRVLSLVHEKRGADVPVMVLLDPRVPLEQLWDVGGIAGKAQLTHLRYFVPDPDTRTMAELKWSFGTPVPFTKKLPPN